MYESKIKKKNFLKKFIGFISVFVLTFGMIPFSSIFAADIDQTSEIQYDANSSKYAFNVRGMPGAFKTTYGDNGYRGYLRFGNNSETKAEGTQLLNLGNGKTNANVGKTGFSIRQDLSFTNENRYVKLSYTLTNNTGSDQVISLGFGTDVQINTNDKAPIYRTETGLRMAEGTASTDRQFNLITKGAYGVTPTDTLWFGHYSSGAGTSGSGTGWQGQMFGNTSLTQLLNTDSGMAWSWKNRPIRDGQTQQYSFLLGIGNAATPPQLMQDITAVCNGDHVDVSAKFKDSVGRSDGIYYVFDMDTENETPATKLVEMTATGEVQTMNASIPKPSSWKAGEVHTVSVWVMNDAGAMSDIKTVRIVVEEDGDNIHEAKQYYLSFDGGEGSSGTGPSSIKAYEQSNVMLPANTFTKADHTFAGWQDAEGNIYPANTEFKMPSENTTLTAFWVENTETWYTIEYYQQNIKDDDYRLIESKVYTANKGDHVVAPEKDFEGFKENTTTSLRKPEADLPATGNADIRLKRYYDRENVTVRFNAMGGSSSAISKTVRYGGMIDPMPTATRQYYKFMGWYDSLDNETAHLYNNLSPINPSKGSDGTYSMDLYAMWDASLDFTTPSVTGTYGSSISSVKLVPSNMSGDVGQVEFEVVSDNMPEGLTLSKDGTISGTPVNATDGDVFVQVKATDKGTGLTKIKQIRVNIAKKQLVIKSIDVSAAPVKIYDGTTAINKSSLDNIIITDVDGILAEDGTLVKEGSKASGLKVKATSGTYDNKNVGTSKNYTLTGFKITGENADNYTVAPYVAGNNGIINKRLITLKPTPSSMDKDEKVPQFSAVLSAGSLGVGDTLASLGTPQFNCTNGTSELIPGGTVTENGDYTLSIIGMSNANANYDIKFQDITFRVRDKYIITTSKSGNGKITPTESYEENSSPVITWEAEDGYKVQRVVVDGVVRDDLVYAGQIGFNNIKADHTVFVEFVVDNSGSNGNGSSGGDNNDGSVVNKYYSIDTYQRGGDAGCSITPSCTVKKGSDKTITWKASSDYKVTKVIIDGIIKSVVVPEGDSITFGNISSDHEVEVVFEKKNGSGSSQETFYTISTAKEGEGSIDPSKIVKPGGAYEVKWQPATGWMVGEVWIDGVKQPEGTRSADFPNITSNHDVRVVFVKDPDYNGGDGDNGGSAGDETEEVYNVKTQIKGGPGEISPSTTVKKGDDYKVSWFVENGYVIKDIEIIQGQSSKHLSPDAEEYTLKNISDDCEVIVTIEKKSLPDGGGAVKQSYDILTGIIGGKGTITPSRLDVEAGKDYKVEWAINKGYKIQSMIVDGKMVNPKDYADNCCNFNNISANHSVYIYLAESGNGSGGSGSGGADKDGIYSITTEIIGKGTITPSSIVSKGSNKLVEWAPAQGYVLQAVYVDGKKVSLPEDNIEFINITASHHVKVVFVKEGSGGMPDNNNQYRIDTGIIGGKGTISPSITLPKGEDYNVSWSVEKGYKVIGVMIDGVFRTDLTSLTGNKNFNDIKANHSVYVYIASTSSGGDNGSGGNGGGNNGNGSGNIKPDNNNLIVSTEIVGKGSITPTTTLKKGSDHTVTWKPAKGYIVWGVEVDGIMVNVPGNSITFDDLASNHHVKVIFIKEDEKDIGYDPYKDRVKVETSIIGGIGSITSGASLDKGDDYTVKWTAGKGYQVQSVIVDGKVRKDLISKGKITFEDLAKNHKVQVILISDEEAERLAKLEEERRRKELEKEQAANGVNTSDESNIPELAIMLFVSLGGILFIGRKIKNDNI
ncbi:InlB B-repeat-containing protein [Anaerofustis sp.]|uniref:InlB B-repeat-containing protein n=1 Tax=Anaerofustis sp. TaxID=1872517 RepID=UPI0025BB3D30|nr:InlB B-repeat-containing protein [Anaerofustis sp.]